MPAGMMCRLLNLRCKGSRISLIALAAALITSVTAAENGTIAGQPISKLKLYIERDCMYRVTGADLASMGIALDLVQIDKLNLYNQGKLVPLAIDGLRADGKLQPTSELTFWGESPKNPAGDHKDFFTRENPYLLDFNSADAPLRYAETAPLERLSWRNKVIQNFARTNRIEQDLILAHYQQFKGKPTDRVMWKDIKAPPRENPKNSIDFSLPDYVEGSTPLAFKVRLWGTSNLPANPDHNWQLKLNGEIIGAIEWDSNESAEFSASLGSKVLRRGWNQLDFVNLHSGDTIDAILLDSLEIEYTAMLWPIDNFIEFALEERKAKGIWIGPGFSSPSIRVFQKEPPIELMVPTLDAPSPKGNYFTEFTYDHSAAATFRAVASAAIPKPERIAIDRPSRLKQSAELADAVVVSHRDFMEALQPLVEHRRSQGLAVSLVDVDDIYDEFNFGRFSPEAIRRFLDLAIERGEAAGKPVRYVFLVGDATYDYLGIRQETPNYVPTHHSDGSGQLYLPDGNPTMAVDDYFVLGPEGEIPRAAIGRLPAKNVETVEQYVRKVLKYETQQPAGDPRAVMIAATGFENYCTNFSRQDMFKRWESDILLANNDKEFNKKLSGSIVDAISGGCDLVYFVGHGAHYLWRTGTAAHLQDTSLFTSEHVRRLENRDRYPIVFASTCFSALFDAPVHPYSKHDTGIGVHFVEVEDRGAIALIASGTKITPGSGDIFTREVMNVLVEGDASTRLGDAFLSAKAARQRDSFAPGILLLGDPALLVGARFADKPIVEASKEDFSAGPGSTDIVRSGGASH